MKRLIALTFALLSSTAFAEYAGEWDQATVLSKSNQEKTLILDVRTESEYAEGHVPGAINIPHSSLEENLEKLKAHKGKDIVIYCRSGKRAGIAEGILTGKGYDKLYHLKGDMNGWKAAKLKIEK